MTSTALATVIIVNYNGAHLLPACLDALADRLTTCAFDTVVVDNASAGQLAASCSPATSLGAGDREPRRTSASPAATTSPCGRSARRTRCC